MKENSQKHRIQYSVCPFAVYPLPGATPSGTLSSGKRNEDKEMKKTRENKTYDHTKTYTPMFTAGCF